MKNWTPSYEGKAISSPSSSSIFDPKEILLAGVDEEEGICEKSVYDARGEVDVEEGRERETCSLCSAVAPGGDVRRAEE